MHEAQLPRAPLGHPWPALPSLADDLRASFEHFLQAHVPADQRRPHGLQSLLDRVFPLRDFAETAQLECAGYRLGPPPLPAATCRAEGRTFDAPLVLTLRLVLFDASRSIRSVHEQEVTLARLPLLTAEGTFVIDGIERVIVRQLAACPGVRFVAGNRGRLSARITPRRGLSLTFDHDPRDRIRLRLGRARKRVLATTLLRALGLTTEEMIDALLDAETYELDAAGRPSLCLDPAQLVGQRAPHDIKVNGEVVVKRFRKFTRAVLRRLQESGVRRLPVDPDDLAGRILARDVIDQHSGEVLGEAAHPLLRDHLRRFASAGIARFSLVLTDHLSRSASLLDTLRADLHTQSDEAALSLYYALRPGDAPTVETARALVDGLFAPPRHDLSVAGRRCLQRKLPTLSSDRDATTLDRHDLAAVLRELARRQLLGASPDDLADLAEAVVRSPADLLEQALTRGFEGLSRNCRERMSLHLDLSAVQPSELLSGAPVQRAIDEFFAWSRVSERVDLTNPLSDLTQRRLLSAVEPDARSMQRTGHQPRPHDSSLGRLCPVESPPRAGAAPALGLRIDQHGQMSTALPSPPGELLPDYSLPSVAAPPERLPAPWEVLGLGAALLPFLEHDAPEAARRGVALLRAALPPLRPTPPHVATGVEADVAHAATLSVRAPCAGVVTRVSARAVELRDVHDLHTIELRTFEPAPRGAHAHQRPVVAVGQHVERGQLLATGPGVASGELALGHPLLTALLPGLAFGPSMLVSERVVREGWFTTVHLREHHALLAARRHERFGREVPGLDPDQLARLDERGLIRPGLTAHPGDVLAGRVRQDDDLLEDISLRLPAGPPAVVIAAHLDTGRTARLPRRAAQRARVVLGELRPLEAGDLLATRHGQRGTVARIAPVEDMPLLPDGQPVDLVLDSSVLAEQGAVGVWMEMLAGRFPFPSLIPPFAGLDAGRLQQRAGGHEQVQLRDGRTGEPLDAPSTVGLLYWMKIGPLAAHTLVARSTGPYDSLTELPIAGQGAHEGQTLDEETLSALLAHGAAHLAHEALHARSDSPRQRELLQSSLRSHDPLPSAAVGTGLEALLRELAACALQLEADDGQDASDRLPGCGDSGTHRVLGARCSPSE